MVRIPLIEAANATEVDVIMAAIVGGAGLRSTYAAVSSGKRICLANKEALVMAGELMIAEARRVVRFFFLSTRSIMRCFNVCLNPILLASK